MGLMWPSLMTWHCWMPGMLTRPQPHEAEAKAEATTHEAMATTHEAEVTTHEAKIHLEIVIIII